MLIVLGYNVIIKRLDGGMLRVKVGRKRSICILRKWDKSRLVYHLKWKQLLRKLVKYNFVSLCLCCLQQTTLCVRSMTNLTWWWWDLPTLRGHPLDSPWNSRCQLLQLEWKIYIFGDCLHHHGNVLYQRAFVCDCKSALVNGSSAKSAGSTFPKNLPLLIPALTRGSSHSHWSEETT